MPCHLQEIAVHGPEHGLDGADHEAIRSVGLPGEARHRQRAVGSVVKERPKVPACHKWTQKTAGQGKSASLKRDTAMQKVVNGLVRTRDRAGWAST